MVVEAVQNYVNLVNGLTRMTRQAALASARSLLSAAGLEDVANDATGRVTKLAEEIMLANRANRELVENLVSTEVDKAAGRLGFVRTEDMDALRDEVAQLRAALATTAATAATAAAATAAAATAAEEPLPTAPESPGSPLADTEGPE